MIIASVLLVSEGGAVPFRIIRAGSFERDEPIAGSIVHVSNQGAQVFRMATWAEGFFPGRSTTGEWAPQAKAGCTSASSLLPQN